MIWSHLLMFSLICIYEYEISCEEVTIHRTQCRRDTMLKKFKKNAKLTGSSNTILRKVTSLAYCVRDCLKTFNCLSVNFKKTATGNENNCELLDIRSTNSSAVVLDKPEWNIYEPVIQVFLSFYFIILHFCNLFMMQNRNVDLKTKSTT